MKEYTYITLREHPELKNTAAEWFNSKWGVPVEAYLECMEDYLDRNNEYGWYLCLDGDKIIGGLGVIEMISMTERIWRRMYALYIQMKSTVVSVLQEICLIWLLKI